VSRRFLLGAVAASAMIAAALSASASASLSGPAAHAAGSCGVGNGLGYGYSYLTSLTVQRTSCGTGKNLARKHGKVGGWHCSRKRLDTSPVQYDDRETCTRGSSKVVWTFTQNT
jgi:hypothetical protein